MSLISYKQEMLIIIQCENGVTTKLPNMQNDV